VQLLGGGNEVPEQCGVHGKPFLGHAGRGRVSGYAVV
jgi:hypothetical protein